MPATEQTWRDSKLLHVIFGVSSLAMLFATIWMLAADHNREWKQFQREFREVETWTAQSRIAQQDNSQYETDLRERQSKLTEEQNRVPPEELIAAFQTEVKADAARRNRVDDYSKLDGLYAELKNAPDRPLTDAEPSPTDKPSVRERLLKEMGRFIEDARFRENVKTTTKKYRAADFDVARSK